MPLNEIVHAAKVFADDLKAAMGLIGSLTTLWIVAEATVCRLGKEKILAF